MQAIWLGFKEAFRSRAFVVCVVVLAASAVGLEWAVSALGVQFRKKAIDLRQPLDRLENDLARFGPYRLRSDGKQTFNEELIATLGTDIFVYWLLEDVSKPSGDPHKYPELFVTYYTGNPDQVPHVPDVCMLASGFTPESRSDDTLDIIDGDGGQVTVPVLTLRYARATASERVQKTVLYTFHSNGAFYGGRAGRTGVRLALGDPRSEYAYFAKVEVGYTHVRGTWFEDGAVSDSATGAATIEASKAVLRTVLPILVNRYFPDPADLTDSNPKPDLQS